MANVVIRPFRFWVQKALPLVYDDSLSYYELLCKVINYLNNMATDFNALSSDVENYFESLDVQEEINNKLDAMVTDGTLAELVGTYSVPIFVTSEQEMTDTNRLYALKSNKMIYQWSADNESFVPTNVIYGGELYTMSAMPYFYPYDTTVDLNIFNYESGFVFITQGASIHSSFPTITSEITEPLLLKVWDNGQTVRQELITDDDYWTRTGTHDSTVFGSWHSIV